jgi:hypothetical protein
MASGWTSEVFFSRPSMMLDDVDRLPHPARDEVAEQGDVGVGDMPVGDASIAPVPDGRFREEVVLPRVDLGAVRGNGLPVAPHAGHVQLAERVDDRRRRFLNLAGGGVLVACQ